ncbi:MAG: membrane protein DedA with SNARE-associated domain [Francisellaceae bacterium]
MSPEWQILINTWGYWLMAFGAIIEGETFLIIGGIAAANGLLHLYGLILLAIIGCLIHDGFFFYLGRFGGAKILQKKPFWQSKIERVTRLLDKYDFWFIIAFRFAYGLRTIIPFALGLSKISIFKFTVFDLIGAIIWSIFFIVGGYYFGQGLMVVMHKLSLTDYVKHHWLISTLALVSFLVVSTFLVYSVKKFIKRSKDRSEILKDKLVIGVDVID